MDHHMMLVGVVIVAALAFDFINGFHDAANSIATIVSTRVLTPQKAVVWSAAFNFLAFAITDLKVANTIGKGIVDPAVIDMAVIMGALGGAIIWNLLTWWWGLPSSSSHALVGGLIGAGLSKGGVAVLGWPKIITTAAFIFISPLVGLFASALMMVIIGWVFRRATPGKIDRWFRRVQLLSAGFNSLGHGTNDAQKTMGIIVVLLFSQGYLGKTFPKGHEIPFWIVLSCFGAMGLGTMAGGWRIVKTMGMRLTKIKPFSGVSADLGGGLAIFFASHLGVPVSTTHTVTGAIVGVGSVANNGRVRWGIARRIVWAWIFTIPAAATMSAITYYLARACGV